MVETVKELYCPSSNVILDHFGCLCQEDVEKVLAAIKLTICPLYPYPSWLVKACGNGVQVSLGEIIIFSLSSGTCFAGLKETVVCLLTCVYQVINYHQMLHSWQLLTSRLILNLSFLGKVVERVVVVQVQLFLDDDSIQNPFHSSFHLASLFDVPLNGPVAGDLPWFQPTTPTWGNLQCHWF